MRAMQANLGAVVSSVLAAVVLAGAGVADGALPQPPAGPAPTVQAVEAEKGPGVFQAAPAEAEPALGPQHPPMDQIPFMPMPEPQTDDDGEPHVFGPLLMHDAETGETIELPVPADVLPTGSAGYNGYPGADGGQYGDQIDGPSAMLGFGDMAKIWNPEDSPWRMNCKVVMRFWATAPVETDVFACCSGSMIDAETVLTAGHCVYSHEPDGWVINDYAEEIWVYPGWDGVGGQFNPPPTTVDHYGYGRGTYFYAGSGWVNSGDLDEDCALIRVTRAVGMLTGWFGTDYGEDCSWYTSHGLHNASFPSECCETGCALHTGSDMYYWNGLVDSCPWEQLQIDTTGGCFNAGWGGMSGSGMYYWDGGDGRLVHAVCSTSDRATWSRYCKLWGSFVTYMNNTFIPGSRGSTFDLQPLDVNAEPASIPAGGATTLLNHRAVNATNGNPGSATYSFDVYLSTNEYISSSDTKLSTQGYIWDFAAMQNLGINMVHVTIPADTPPGNYWIGVLYDSSTDSYSSNNNTEGWDSAPITVTCPSQSAPTGVTATDGTYTGYVQVTWSAPTGGTEYRVYRNETNSSSGATALGTSWQSGTSYNDTTATPGVTYYYWVKARNFCGNVSGFSPSNSGWRKLSPPTNVLATDGTYVGLVRVTWNAAAGANYYLVYRNTTNDSGSATSISGWISSQTYDDTSATPGVTYYYWVKGAPTAGSYRSSDFSGYNSGWRALTPPSPIDASDGTYTGYVRVTWGSMPGASHYLVYRNTTNDSGTATALGSWQAGTSRDDTTATPGDTYYYWVKAATSSSGYRASGFSISNSGWRKLSPPTNVSATDGTYGDRVRVSWTAADGASHYRVYRNTTNDSGSATALGSWQTTLSYTDYAVTPGATYYYWVKAATSSAGKRASDFSLPDKGHAAEEPEVSITAWWSVREHAGPVKLAIKLSASASGFAVVSEPRDGGVRQVAIDFNSDVTAFYTPGQVVVTGGGGFAVTGEALVNAGTRLEIDLNGGTNETCATIDIGASVSCLTGDTDCAVRILIGDTNGDSNTNNTDKSQVAQANGTPAGPTTAFMDINLDGSINNTDKSFVASLNGTSASCP